MILGMIKTVMLVATSLLGIELDETFLYYPLQEQATITCDFACCSSVYPNCNHKAIDFRASNGTTPVFAAASGVVAAVEEGIPLDHHPDDKPYGNHVKIRHSNGYVTIYAHLAPGHNVSMNSEVSAGQLIGFTDNTGRTTASHLHFEVQDLSRRRVNPYGDPPDYTSCGPNHLWVSCPPRPYASHASLEETLTRLRACSEKVPTYARVFTSKSAEANSHGTSTIDVATFAKSGCFVADAAEDSVAPATEPEKTRFRQQFEAANPVAVLGRHSPFVEIPKQLARDLSLPEKAFIHCANLPLTENSRIESWYHLNWVLTPVTQEGKDSIVKAAGQQVAQAVHPVLYFDSLLDHLWYFADQNPQCGDSDPPGTHGYGKMDIDFDGDGQKDDDLNDPRWLQTQLEVLDEIRQQYNIGLVANVTEASSACKFAPHVDGLTSELGTYVADADGKRENKPRKPISWLEAWAQQTRFCAGGFPCFRAVLTSADPDLDIQLKGSPFPWDRTDIWQAGGVMDKMMNDEGRINSAHVLAALVGASPLSGTIYWWSIGPFPSRWINASTGHLTGWLDGPRGDWLLLASDANNRLDGREYDGGVVLWNDNESTESVSVAGWLGSSLNPPNTGGGVEGQAVSTVALNPRSGVVLVRPANQTPVLPSAWQDSRITSLTIAPGEDVKPLRVTVYYQPGSDVNTVSEMKGWATGREWAPLTNCDLNASPAHCEMDGLGCVANEFQVSMIVTPANANGEYWDCYSVSAGDYVARGTTWVDTNHGQRVSLQCAWCQDPNDLERWCTNYSLPPAVILR